MATQKAARDLEIGDHIVVTRARSGVLSGKIIGVARYWGVVWVWLEGTSPDDPATVQFNHGDPVTLEGEA